MITTIPDRERALQAQVDALTEELASVEASNRIRGDELARLRDEMSKMQQHAAPPADIISRSVANAKYWMDRAEHAEADLERLRAQEPCAHMYPSDLERFQTNETFATAYSVAVGCPDERSEPLYRSAPPAQPAEPTIDEQVASVNAVFDAWRNGEDATLTLGLAAQPAHPNEFACPLCFDDPANIKPAEPVQWHSPLEQDAMGIAMVRAWDLDAHDDGCVHPLYQRGFTAGWKAGYKHGAWAAQPADSPNPATHEIADTRLSDVLLDIDSVEHMQGGANGPTIRLRGFINAQTVPTAPQPPIDNAFVAEGCERFSTPAEPAPVPCCGKYETCSHACTPRGRWLGRRESALQPGWRDIETPQGWKLVPVEPTPEMVAAYLDANDEYWKRADELPPSLLKWRNGTPKAATAESYRAMLEAAPLPPKATK